MVSPFLLLTSFLSGRCEHCLVSPKNDKWFRSATGILRSRLQPRGSFRRHYTYTVYIFKSFPVLVFPYILSNVSRLNRGNVSPFTLAKPVSKWATLAGSCTVLNMESSQTVKCRATKPSEVETTRSTPSSARPAQENTFPELCLSTWNPLLSVRPSLEQTKQNLHISLRFLSYPIRVSDIYRQTVDILFDIILFKCIWRFQTFCCANCFYIAQIHVVVVIFCRRSTNWYLPTTVSP